MIKWKTTLTCLDRWILAHQVPLKTIIIYGILILNAGAYSAYCKETPPLSALDNLDIELSEWAYLPLNKELPIRSATLIRVKVFPHLKSYKPHGQDTQLDQVTLSGDRPCRQYPGLANWAWRKGKTVTKTAERFDFSAATLTSPVFLACSGSVKIHRGDGLPEYVYQGSFYIRKNSKGHVEVVNILSLYQYLRGVVPSEVYSYWQEETLKTQAVAARTYAVFHLTLARKMGRRFYDVDDTVAYQAFTGVSFTSYQADKAVRETIGEVLTFGDHIIQSYYHADSGGSTEYARNVWGYEVPYCAAIKEKYTLGQSQVNWQRVIDLRNLQYQMIRRGLLAAGARVVGLTVPESGRTESGRVKRLAVTLQDQSYVVLDIAVFKKVLGGASLQSTLFTVEPQLSKKYPHRYMILKGQGFGHGVGMSQTGAEFLARDRAWAYDRILEFYYQGVKLCSLEKISPSLDSCYDDRSMGGKPSQTVTEPIAQGVAKNES